MKVTFTGRHVEVSNALKAQAEERLVKMATFLDDIIDVHVTFSVEKHRHEAEVSLKTRASAFVASAESLDMYKSLAEAMDKLESQAHKQAAKRKEGRHEATPRKDLVAEEA
ncbi:MAG: ribosome-associated translation inhibitor RaiA [Acidobacteria bacterium]|nr:ribosome-associated translation inhibitor RaiA [Acidobacteriota bacterium]